MRSIHDRPSRRKPALPNPARPAFSLPELLVVIGVVVVLLAVSLPAMRQARTQSRGVVSGSNIRQLGMIVSMYADDAGVVPTVFEPVYFPDPTDEQTVATRWGVLRGNWFHNGPLFQYALAEQPAPQALTAPGHPDESARAAIDQLGTVNSDFGIAATFYADPAYWDRHTQAGPTQWRSQRLDRVRYPSAKALMHQLTVYDVPGSPEGYMACCVDEVWSAVLWSDLSASREIQARLLPGVPNFWFPYSDRPPPSFWDSGVPIDNTQDGILGRDR